MHLLLIAYEYPPIESAHSLRWGYLARELARLGHTLDVVSVDLSGNDEPFAHPGIAVTRTFAGPFVGTARCFGRQQRRQGAPPRRGDEPAPTATPTPGFAERAYRALRGGLDHVLVPDVRTEWLPWGLHAAERLLRARRPDVVVASHEPGVDLAIGRRISRRHALPLLADLGDPLLASYSPRWRRGIDAAFERRWLSAASGLSVTNAATRDLLRARVPALERVPIVVVPQGFDTEPPAQASAATFDAQRLELLYTGTLYGDFRHPGPLLDALDAVPRARLTVLGSAHGIDPSLLSTHPQVRFLGRCSHAQVRATQRAAQVLVNIGNREDVQLPGKLFEYLGAGRPVLHLAQTDSDPSAALVRRGRFGIATPAARDAIAAALGALDRGEVEFAPDASLIASYAWPSLAAGIESLLHDVARRGPAVRP